MVLIAESGATKTEWRLINSDQSISNYKSSGYNPLFGNPIIFASEVSDLFRNSASKIRNIYFYGVGCFTEKGKKMVIKTLAKVFPNATFEINSDLLAAARALFNEKSGIAAILGTGSSSCFYNGNSIKIEVPSLGYLLADEGSGFHLGKELIKKYYYHEMPEEMKEKFKQKYEKELPEFIAKAYEIQYPNRLIANFTYFLSENIDNHFVQNLVKNCFQSFFKNHLQMYKHTSVGFIGSIAYIFKDIIKEKVTDNNLKLIGIEKSAIKGLVKFHA